MCGEADAAEVRELSVKLERRRSERVLALSRSRNRSHGLLDAADLERLARGQANTPSYGRSYAASTAASRRARSAFRSRCRRGSGTGTAEKSAFVYSCFGFP